MPKFCHSRYSLATSVTKLSYTLQVELGKGLGKDGLTVKGLLREGYEAIFLGVGLPEPKIIPIFDGLTPEQGFYTSKNFLPLVAQSSKPGKEGYCSLGYCICSV